MAKTKFSLNAAPTFTLTVAVPVQGGADAEIQITFRHKQRKEFASFVEKLEGRKQSEVLEEIIAAWDLEDELNKANLLRLTDNYMGASETIIGAYVDEMTRARRGN